MPRTGIDQNIKLNDNEDTIIYYEDDQGEDSLIESDQEIKQHQDTELIQDPEPHQDVTEMKHVSGGLEAFLRTWKIDHAEGVDGKIYHGTEEIVKHLEDYGSRLILMNKDETTNIAIETHYTYHGVKELDRAKDRDSEKEEIEFKYSKDRTPGKRMLLCWNEEKILYARDKDGNRYETVEEIRKALSEEDKMLFIYTNEFSEYEQILVEDAEKEEDRRYRQELRRDKKEANAVVLRNGKYYVSVGEIREEELDKVKAEDLFERPETLDERRILDWKEEDIAYAEDAEGKKYDGPEAVKYALSGVKVPKEIYDSMEEEIRNALPTYNVELTVHFKDERKPVLVKRENDRFAIEREKKQDQDTEESIFTLKDIPEDDFEELNIVDLEFQERFQQRHFAFAVDEDGKRYNSYSEAMSELHIGKEKKKLFVFEKGLFGLEAYAAEKQNGRLYVSDQEVTPETRLEDSEAYTPLKSLDTDPLIRFDLLKEDYDLKEKKDDTGKRLKVIENDLNTAKKYKDEGAPKPPQMPVKPKLGIIDSILWGLKKIITLGFGDTDANRKLKQDLRKYEEELLPKYNKEMSRYKKMSGRYKRLSDDVYVGKLKEEQKKLKSDNQAIKQKKWDLFDQIYKDGYDRRVEMYQSRIEVKLAGVKDLEEKGRITVDNLFAYTWLKAAELENKDLKDPAVRESLMEYIAAVAIKKRIIEDRTSYTTHSKALDQRNVEELNNGNAVRYLKNDEVLKKCIDEAIESGEPLAPYSFYLDYLSKLGNVEQRQKDSAERMKKMCVQMVKNFGEQTVTMEALDEVIRFERAMKVIKRTEMYHNADKLEKGQISDSQVKVVFDEAKTNTTRTLSRVTDKEREPYLPAFEALKGKGPMKLDEMHRQIIHKTKELEKAKQQVMKK